MRVPLDVIEGELILDADAARYVTRVHRLGVGDRFEAFDPAQRLEAAAEIVEVGKQVVVMLTDVRAATRVARRQVTLIQSLAKGTKVDAVIRDATELGATRVIPALAERSVKRGGDIERWRRVALDAARQCGRGDVPIIDEVMALPDALRAGGGGIVLHPDATTSFGDVPSPNAIVVGPEGGFTADELQDALSCGYVAARLGSFVLRSETACAAALGALLGRDDAV
jgi:16S rRNA (uracil1498-N3)-methyltransferase